MHRKNEKFYIAICDPSAENRRLLKELFRKSLELTHDEDVEFMTFDTGRRLLHRVAIRSKAYDLILIHNHLPEGSGFEIADEIFRYFPDQELIYLSESERDAMESFRHGAIYHLGKPFNLFDIRLAIGRLDQRLLKKKLYFRSEGQQQMVLHENIRYITEKRNDATLWMHPKKGGQYKFQRSMGQLEKELGQDFLRIRRNTLINMNHVRDVHPEKRKFIMDDGQSFQTAEKSFSRLYASYRRFRNEQLAREEKRENEGF